MLTKQPKAAERAEQIIDTAPFEAGPYAQTVTFNSGAGNPTVTTEGDHETINQTQLEFLMAANKDYIQTKLWLLLTPISNFTYNIATCKRDVGLIPRCCGH